MGYRPVTSIAQPNSIIYDSCKWEYSSEGINWTSLGVARGVKFTENIETASVQTDNGPDIKKTGEQTVTISANLLEFYLPNLAAVRGSLDSLSITTANATTDTDVYSTGALVDGYGKIIWLQNQGAIDTLPAIATVKSVDTDNASVALDSTRDFTVITDTNNRSRRGIILIPVASGGKFSDTEGLRINYVYGAIAARKMTSGGFSDIGAKWHRLTNAEVIGGVVKYRYFVVYSASITKGLDLSFKSANESDSVLEFPFEVQAKLDTTRSAGDQLFYIEDECATA